VAVHFAPTIDDQYGLIRSGMWDCLESIPQDVLPVTIRHALARLLTDMNHLPDWRLMRTHHGVAVIHDLTKLPPESAFIPIQQWWDERGRALSAQHQEQHGEESDLDRGIRQSVCATAVIYQGDLSLAIGWDEGLASYVVTVAREDEAFVKGFTFDQFAVCETIDEALAQLQLWGHVVDASWNWCPMPQGRLRHQS
jgi:hypothetical protein